MQRPTSTPMTPQDEEIQKLRLALSTLQDEFKEFVYTVSHDLNAPLRSIVHFSALLNEHRTGQSDETELCYLDMINDGGKKAQLMLAGLLQYSRLITQAEPMAAVDVATAVEHAGVALNGKIISTGAKIEINGLPTVNADGSQLNKLFYTLIENALLYRKKDVSPKIHIHAEDTGNQWRITVEDNGIGIAPEYREMVFHMFKRLHLYSEYPGVGMGLVIAKKIVERHGGVIGLSESPLGGTACWFTLPKSKSISQMNAQAQAQKKEALRG